MTALWTMLTSTTGIITGVVMLAIMGFGAYQSFRVGFLEGQIEQQNILLVQTGAVLGRSELNNADLTAAIGKQTASIEELRAMGGDIMAAITSAEKRIEDRYKGTREDITARLNRQPQPGQNFCDAAFEILSGVKR